MGDWAGILSWVLLSLGVSFVIAVGVCLWRESRQEKLMKESEEDKGVTIMLEKDDAD